ncbi:MAG: restriction endonuclease subunit S [Verrucomicrobiales bacterium]|nr:restriction endonuclease subunit S [Verrucomicrobiales bacterium]
MNGKAFKPADWSASGVPIIRIQNLNGADRPYNFWAGSLTGQVQVRRGDLLLAWSGTPGTSFGAHIWDGPNSVLNQHIFRCDIDRTQILPKWAKFVVNVQLNRLIHLAHGGVGLKHVTRPVVDALQVPLPPLPEQDRIADVLDRAEALRAKRRATLAKLDSLTQSLFLDIFGTRLDAPPIDTRAQRVDVPRGCSWKLLTDVARLATGHTPDRERSEYWNGEIPWISLTDIRALDGTIATRTLQNITPLGIDNSSSVLLPKGTVCFSRTASVGFVTVMGREMATSQDFMNWVCGPTLDPTYLMWALITSRKRLLALSSGSTHRTIYMRVVEQFHVLLPPIAMQREFSRRVAAVEKLKVAHRASLAELDALFASLQNRAFRGEL